MILATVTTCPQRWETYQHFRRNFESLTLPFPLRTFQTTECAGDPFANNNLNARAALGYCHRHLPSEKGWMLYLEDDVQLGSELKEILPWLMEYGEFEQIDMWYLCNRKNPVVSQTRMGSVILNKLGFPIDGSHGLLIPRRHIGHPGHQLECRADC
jgi:hypothetical protein